jgi:membrane protease YdiL (CAAX protease family)
LRRIKATPRASSYSLAMTDPDPIPFRAVYAFTALTFGIAWGIFALFAAFPEPITRLMGEPSRSHPLFILAVYAPAISAILLILIHAGPSGLARFLFRLTLWRLPLPWLAVLLIGIPACFVLGAFLSGKSPALAPGVTLGALAFMLVLGPVEEFGWRGMMQPLLQRRMAPIWAGLLIGLIWGVWHLPAFFLGGTPQSNWSILPFLIGTTALGVIVTPLFNAAKGSLLWAALFHFQLNNPLWPDAQPMDTWVFVALAVLVVWLNRKAMFDRTGVTEVVPKA